MHTSRAFFSPTRVLLLVSVSGFALAACGEAGAKTADVVQAATKEAAEAGKHLAAKAAELAEAAPEEARAKLQGWLETAASELREIRDSETAQRVVVEVERALDAVVEVARKLGQALNLEGLKDSVADMVARFRDDPRVAKALASLREKLDALAD